MTVQSITIWKWESVRASPYRMCKPDHDPDRVIAFRHDYPGKARAKRGRSGILGLTTEALFGVGSKPV